MRILRRYFNVIIFSAYVKKALFSDFYKVVCLHTQGEVTDFGTLRCVIHFWLIWCKNYRNRPIFAKVVAKSLLSRFYAPQCTIKNQLQHNCDACKPVLFSLLQYRHHLLWEIRVRSTIFSRFSRRLDQCVKAAVYELSFVLWWRNQHSNNKATETTPYM